MKRSAEAGAIGAATAGTGAAIVASIASACCVGPSLAPLFLALLGASGLVAVSTLRPYAPWMLIGAALMLAFSFRRAYRKPACVGAPISRGVRVARAITWIAAVLWIVSTAYAVYGFINE